VNKPPDSLVRACSVSNLEERLTFLAASCEISGEHKDAADLRKRASGHSVLDMLAGLLLHKAAEPSDVVWLSDSHWTLLLKNTPELRKCEMCPTRVRRAFVKR
jgi:hypothetical protein